MSVTNTVARTHRRGVGWRLGMPVVMGALALATLPAVPAQAAATTIWTHNASTREGDFGRHLVKVPVTLSHKSSRRVVVNYTTVRRTATSPRDYVTERGTLTFRPGVTRKYVAVPVKGDLVREPNETFKVVVSHARNAAIVRPAGVVTITNDDACVPVSNGVPPSLAIRNDVTKTEGWTANNVYKFLVELSQPSTRAVCVDWSTVNGTAVAPSDYTSASGTLVFRPGETEKILGVAAQGDIIGEPDEAFRVRLSTPVNAAITDADGVATILNDDCTDGDEGIGAATNLGIILGDAASNPLTATNRICAGDADWYKFRMREWDGTIDDLTARISLEVNDYPAQTQGDLELAVYRADQTLVKISDKDGTADETVLVKRTDTGTPDDETVVYVKVYGFAGHQVNAYTLTVTGDVDTGIAPNL